MSIRDDALGWDIVVDGGEPIFAVVKSLTTEEIVARTTKQRLAVKNVCNSLTSFPGIQIKNQMM